MDVRPLARLRATTSAGQKASFAEWDIFARQKWEIFTRR